MESYSIELLDLVIKRAYLFQLLFFVSAITVLFQEFKREIFFSTSVM